MLTRRTVMKLGLVVAAPGTARVAQARTETAHVVIGFPPGALGDVLARRLAEGIKASGYADNAVVENRTGAGGRIALAAVKAAKPDGLTMVLQPASLMTILPHAYKTRPYDPFKDFVAVGATGEMDMCLTVNPNVIPIKSLSQYVEYVKRNPEKGKYGTGGIGSIPHLLGFMLARATGAEIEHVPYRGGPASLQDLLAAQIPAAMGALQKTILDAHRDGRLRIIATSGRERNVATPEVETFEEVGFPQLSITDYTGVWMPAGTPAAAVEKVNAVLLEVFAKDRDFLAQWANTPLPLTPRQFAARVKKDYDAMASIVKAAGFTIDAA